MPFIRHPPIQLHSSLSLALFTPAPSQLPPFPSSVLLCSAEICFIILHRSTVGWALSTMLQHLFVFGMLGVLLTPARCDLITVCREDDGDLRVDCLVKGKPNKINSYEFSWSSGSKQSLINSNVSGLAAEAEFRQVSRVTEVEPHGYRLTLSGYGDKLPHNTTYMCKITGEGASVNVERDHLIPCGAVSVFLQNSWIVAILLLYHCM